MCTCDNRATSATRATARDGVRVINEQLAFVFSCALLAESDDACALLRRYSWSD